MMDVGKDWVCWWWCWWDWAFKLRRCGEPAAEARAEDLGLDLSTEPRSEERRDLKTGLALSLGSCGLCWR